MKRSDGFTLTEILVVVAIIGLLASLFGMNMVRSIQRARLDEAAVTVESALNRGRSAAQKLSQDQVITWTPQTLTVGNVQTPIPNGVTFNWSGV